ncbi:preprotein translocase subunit SecE [Nitrococcus mobilis]|uniref:Protein translocase subunit SecE n=1 Tax=Nitrococcus mobilis Nb-231 TaxID=314278 RepID=A4BT61_9GAMM|nr:preprotein translocase subunit SecE [Nitrococcus mobilis]EAR21129.1 preprotein translocase, SecE subunit [Nitrococcus mobilis Nb-231]
MNARAESESSVIDTIKLVVAALVFLGGVGGFYYYSDELLLYRVLGLLAVSLVAVGICMTTHAGREVWAFARDSRQELRKVVWPTKQESLQSTLVVLVVVVLVGVFLWLLDTFFLWAIQLLLHPGG